MAQARRRNLMLQHQEEIEEKVRKLLTSQVFRVHFLQKLSLRVSKCTYMWFFFIFQVEVSPTQTTIQEVSSFPLLQFDAFFFSFGCMMRSIWRAPTSLNQSSKERWTPRARGSFSSVTERWGVPWRWRLDPTPNWGRGLQFFPGQVRGEVLAKVEVTPGPGWWGGFRDGRACRWPRSLGRLSIYQGRSFAGLLGRFQWWLNLLLAKLARVFQRLLRSLLCKVTEEVLVMDELAFGQARRDSRRNCSFVGLPRRSRRWLTSFFGQVHGEDSMMADLAFGASLQGRAGDDH